MALGVFFLLVGIWASELAAFGFRQAGFVAAACFAVAMAVLGRVYWRTAVWVAEVRADPSKRSTVANSSTGLRRSLVT